MQEIQETQVQSLGWEDPLEKEMATHSNILSWRNPWTEEPGGLQSMRSQRVRHDLATQQQQHGVVRKRFVMSVREMLFSQLKGTYIP